MDFNLKQWRQDSDADDATKLSGLDLLNQQPPAASSALSLFVPESSAPAATKFSISGMGMSYFSLSQWQELELQALIFRHMTAGGPVPPELLHLVKKSLVDSQNSSHYFPHQCYPHHYHSPLVQSGYWGRAAMDPEPGRCRRTDGKKWRCSRDVVVGQKYCERHMHRGRNRSRKPVEPHASTASTYGGDSKSAANSSSVTRPSTASGDFLSFNNPSEGPFEAQKEAQPNNGMFRHFFDDWPKSVVDDEMETSLSISTPGNVSSDFSLKLGYSNGDEGGSGRDKGPVGWGLGWETNLGPLPSMGGPLAEVLRSSTTSGSSPTSVLRPGRRGGQLPSEVSYGSS
ncbi:growth-regulating factor 4-like isoform X2 [Andrographis paniculata]|uniref:growth-regulating factor 4-like isoform X2 n=1 Tax=Andrographis paniculata TaxID=175694 RepID=UPI0021E7D25E|nr:growth-regulating factor 4-like isoform X2 [Andrographis paniculata]